MIQAWPFLIGRNQKIDHRILLSPPQLIEQKTTFSLVRAATGDILPEGCAYYQKTVLEPFGPVALVYRVLLARKSFLGQTGDEPLHDLFDREFYIIEGVLLEGEISSLSFTDHDIEIIHSYTEAIYRDFWKRGSEAFPIQPARPIDYPFQKQTEDEKSSPIQLISKESVLVPSLPEAASPPPHRRDEEVLPEAASPPPPLPIHKSSRRRFMIAVGGSIGALALLVGGGITGYEFFQHRLDPPTGFTVTSVTLKNGQIIAYHGQTIPMGNADIPFTAQGTDRSEGSGFVWVVLGDMSRNYYLQTSPVRFLNSTNWTTGNINPGNNITSVYFVAVTPAGDGEFNRKVSRGEFGAFTNFPQGSQILGSATLSLDTHTILPHS